MPNAKTKAARTLRNPIEAAQAKLAETYQKQYAKLTAKVARLEVELNTRDIALSKASDAYNKALADLADARRQLDEIRTAALQFAPVDEDNE